jgi:hypothetical protein
LLGIAALVLFAAAITASVLIPARDSFDTWRHIKSAFGVLIWVAPAIAILVLSVKFVAPRTRDYNAPARKVVIERPGDEHAAADGSIAHVGQATDHDQSSMRRAARAGLTSFVAGAARLKVRSTSSDDPNWTAGPSRTATGRDLYCLTSQRFATLVEAEDQITAMAVSQVRDNYCHGSSPESGLPEWSGELSQSRLDALVELINRYGVQNLIGEIMDKDFGNGIKGKMHRAHLRLEFSPQLRSALVDFWRTDAVDRRLLALASLVGLATLMLGTAACYFRIDAATGGMYRGRLKLAAVSVIAAGSLAVPMFFG